jgi:hypothetical protein
MPPLQIVVLAVLALTALGVLRVVRVHLGRTPLPDGSVRWPFFFAFLIGPPLVLGALTQPASGAGALRGISSLPIYVPLVAILVVLMALVSSGIGSIARGRSSRLLRLALTGSQDHPAEIRTDPPLTAELAQGLASVDKANAVFPRGAEFPAQVDRAGFRADWDALDGATRALEGQIAEDDRLLLGVASRAVATAKDARARLDALRSIAVDGGQTWPAS